ncbi:hypothetical protein PI87_23570 [Ralstonia sp. A12]|uniref:hypothetical protein n=1 Tax=Ralstonia sp. A12 TaxID=1217052 RepID=UPI00057353E3|nr:hypothetical protein [Ralstonia sp. A12]KHK50345.1 hypothetical protein PI87_23570 [Ralstonia sp. A12]
MSRMPFLPSGCRGGLPFVVPDDWTPEQALTVFELLEDLLVVFSSHYGVQLHDLLREQRQPAVTVRSPDSEPPF